MELKDKIVEAAAKSFAMFGYKGTTMDRVAKIANVGKGTIYTFFASKEELFQHILNRLIAEMGRVAEQAIDRDRSFFDNLNRALTDVMRYRKDHELFVMLAREMREIGTAAVSEGLQKVEDTIVRFIAAKLADAIAQGDVKPCDPQLVAFIMLKTYTSLVFEWEQKYGSIRNEEISSAFRLIFAEGLRK